MVDRYFQEFIFSGKLSDPEGRFFEKRILLEFISLASAAVETDSKTEFEQFGESALHRAIAYIESRLFEPLTLQQISRKSHASVSNLNRFFKKELGMTAFLYIRNRRLDEAMQILKANDGKSVGEVALLVGYENIGSFTEAFKKKFGYAPSRIAHGK